MPDPPRDPRDQDPLQQWYKLAGVGMEFFVALLVPGALGYWLDAVLHTRPWLMIAGGLLGFGVGLWLLIKAANNQFRQ